MARVNSPALCRAAARRQAGPAPSAGLTQDNRVSGLALGSELLQLSEVTPPMAPLRLSRLLLGLVLIDASQLPARAEDSQPADASATAPAAPEAPAGDGVRPADHAEPVTPRERPRLKDNEVVSLKRRLEVHGGMSFTYGWASGGRDFREAGAWVSYFDPESGLGLGFGFSRFSGDVPYGYGYYPYAANAYTLPPWYFASPRSAYDVDLFLVRPNFSIDIGFSQTDFSNRSALEGAGLRPRRF